MPGSGGLEHRPDFVRTSRRLILMTGIRAARLSAVSLRRVLQVHHTQTPLGRSLSYGTLVIAVSDRDLTWSRIRFVPDPARTAQRISAAVR
ncbi:PH domain-containing protein [Dactylosporangium sp. NPDC050688]|uniref:PH domain-containing protein n=1 Tax=Dactylosporangium sp. NPDC050688 TaxID=3157217 RepID=UPI0033F0EDCD